MTAVRRLSFLALCLVVLTGCVGIDISAQSEQARGSFERTLTVSGPVELSVRTGSGDIQIRTGETHRVQVSGRIRAGDSRRTTVSPAERVRQVEQMFRVSLEFF